ncbi:hypothetical protein CG017_05881 (plasmid) [Burkholderia glumae]|nr:hypothetical protein CG017_05881 [Burkholderia glumae]
MAVVERAFGFIGPSYATIPANVTAPCSAASPPASCRRGARESRDR